jgi:hypothetical protein
MPALQFLELYFAHLLNSSNSKIFVFFVSSWFKKSMKSFLMNGDQKVRVSAAGAAFVQMAAAM